jgi:S1-C subfamily serine protease
VFCLIGTKGDGTMSLGILLSIFCLSAQADITTQNNNTDDTVQTAASMEKQYAKASVSVVEVGRHNSGGYGTGTVFELNEEYFVLTAAHVVAGVETPVIRQRDIEIDGKIVYYNKASDVAVISIQSDNDLVPITTKFRKKGASMGESVFYCGFPNRKDTACFSGLISHVDGDTINIHSYAWMGASGSAILDKRGRVVGVLSAVEVGVVWGRPQIIEDVVWVRALDESFWKAYSSGFQNTQE